MKTKLEIPNACSATRVTADRLKSLLAGLQYARSQNAALIGAMKTYRGAFEGEASRAIFRVTFYDQRLQALVDSSLDLMSDLGSKKISYGQALAGFADAYNEAATFEEWWDDIAADLAFWKYRALPSQPQFV